VVERRKKKGRCTRQYGPKSHMNCKIAERVSARGDAGEIESHERMKMSSK